MNIQKVKRKYPYKETKAVIVKIIRKHAESGYVTAYDKYDAIDDLRMHDTTGRLGLHQYDKYAIYDKVSEHADRHWGIVEEDFLGNPVSKVFEHWYEYTLVVEYKDLNGQIHQGIIEMTFERNLSIGNQTDVCYFIENPDEVAIKSYKTDTIEDYLEQRNMRLLLLCSVLFFIIIIGVVYIKEALS